MSFEEKVEESISIIDSQIKDLSEIIIKVRSDGDFDSAYERIERWKERTARLLEEKIHPNEGENLRKKEKGSFLIGKPLRNLEDECMMYLGFLKSLKETILKHPKDVLSIPTPKKKVPDAVINESPENNVVFVVHGHDELNLLRLKELVKDRWKLEPVVLSTEPGKGRTLIEKFEEEAQRASFALVLFTPDDFVEVNDGVYSQARPNAIFELGWFYGRLGRNKVCILFKKDTKIHSDLDGISRIEFSENITEKVSEIELELISAGILIQT